MCTAFKTNKRDGFFPLKILDSNRFSVPYLCSLHAVGKNDAPLIGDDHWLRCTNRGLWNAL